LSYLLLRDIRLRTTFSATDSAGLKSERLATVDYFAHVLNMFKDAELKKVLAVGTQREQGIDSEVLSSYKEAQIHGEIRLADHVELVMAHTSLHRAGRLEMLQVVWIEGGIDCPPGQAPPPVPPPVALHRHASSKASSRPAAPATEEVWEVQGDDGWVPFPDEVQELIRRAQMNARGQRVASFQARGFSYEVNLDDGVQRNLTTGRRRMLRQVSRRVALRI